MSYKKSKAGGGDYYIHAQTADDYYSNVGTKEPPGEWYAAAGTDGSRRAFTLTDGRKFDAASADEFRSLVQGFDPITGHALTQNSGAHNRVALHDFTFSAPKSLSVIWSQADEGLRQDISEAQRQAAREALDFLSQKAGFTRRGKGGQMKEPVPLIGALFEHGSSRENDPQLHTHCVILNLATRRDGTTGSIETKDLMSWQGAAASIYHASLSRRIADLGFGIRCEDKLFEIAGVPEIVCDAFSQRRAAIEEAAEAKAAELGVSKDTALASRSLMQQATIETRQAKNELTRTELLNEWHVRGVALGFGPTEVEVLRHPNRAVDLTVEDRASLTATAAEQLTVTSAVFGEQALYTQTAIRLMGRGTGIDIEAAVSDLKPHLLATEAELGVTRYTTPEMRLIEQRMLELASQTDATHQLPRDAIELAISIREGMSEEQADAVRHAVADNKACSVIQGAAGAGKTFSMQTVAQLYRSQGYELHGLATTWTAAETLKREAGLDSHRAIAGWLADVESGNLTLNKRSLVIVDEAGLVGARDMSRVLEASRNAGAKIILSGDEKQLASIDAGDALRTITQHCGGARIDTIRRQYDPRHRAAIKDLFNGRADQAMTTFSQDLKLCSGPEATAQALFEAWRESRAGNAGKSHMMIAMSNADVARLNALARAHLIESGELGKNSISVEAIDSSKASPLVEFRVGDQVAFRTNNKTLDVYNRTHARITGVEGPVITLQTQDGRAVRMDTTDPNWFDRKREVLALQHAYAVNSYNSQGLTIDRTFVRDSVSMDRRTIAVSMSRHRESCRVFVDRSEHYLHMIERGDRTDFRHSAEVSDAEILESVKANWERNKYKTSTLDFESRNDGWRTSSGARFDAAACLRFDALAHRSSVSDQAPPSTHRTVSELPFQQRSQYEIRLPPIDVAEAMERRVALIAQEGIEQHVVAEAERQGVLAWGHEGARELLGGPTFVGRDSSGRIVNVITETQIGSSQSPGVLRHRFPPVLHGDIDSAELHIVGSGRDALAIWSERERAGLVKPTIIIAQARPDALSNAPTRALFAKAATVTVHVRADEPSAAAVHVASIRQVVRDAGAVTVEVRRYSSGHAPADVARRDALAAQREAERVRHASECRRE